ncbi:1,4-alpha-glucan branching protein [Streptomyces sp. VRA16 Mangrove soil]|uniref:maltokinase N-terminal cap-like domain-containing protein n=1 Tax=Streptomyces sp. VRA16 Mangrove soil TaxID=2817434 RepID=UPI001A9F9B22|nr:1,4-alpha-glucan branching protein [Streptomyces sp. VRA16 Mangrove soil]MBO1336448.1 1,4-alpha-glucan branching protein [Streptomyces sp. VRA16 Mangrove soil]
MAIIHRTTLKPTKLELLTDWLPKQPWYRGTGTPELGKAGGFRLDDPAGQVGIEFLAATDTSGPEPVTYHVPMTYRGAPLPDADDALIGTLVHGVLGDRWVYDGTRDPLLMGELAALLRGEVPAHAQSVDGELDPTVHASLGGGEGRLEIVRVLEPGSTAAGGVTAEWDLGNGSRVRGVFAVVRGD